MTAKTVDGLTFVLGHPFVFDSFICFIVFILGKEFVGDR